MAVSTSRQHAMEYKDGGEARPDLWKRASASTRNALYPFVFDFSLIASKSAYFYLQKVNGIPFWDSWGRGLLRLTPRKRSVLNRGKYRVLTIKTAKLRVFRLK